MYRIWIAVFGVGAYQRERYQRDGLDRSETTSEAPIHGEVTAATSLPSRPPHLKLKLLGGTFALVFDTKLHIARESDPLFANSD